MTELAPAAGWRRIDLAVLGLLALYAALVQWGRSWGTSPFFFLGVDGSYLASYAAARADPALFVGDPALGDPAGFRFYTTLQTELLPVLARFAGDAGTALVSTLGLSVFAQAAGFYWLGIQLLGSRGFAFLFSVVNLAPVTLPMWMQWGTLHDPLPRIALQAVLPFVLAAVLALRDRPRQWAWIPLFSGMLVYVHPVAAPAWGFAIWLGMLAFRPRDIPAGRTAGVMLALGFGYLAVIAPFVWIYLRWHAHGTMSDELVVLVRSTMETYLPRGYFDVGYGVRQFASFWWKPSIVVWLGAGLGLPVLLWLRRPDRRVPVAVLLWLVGVLLVSLGVPFVDQALAQGRDTIPFQVDLIRGLRFMLFFGLLFVLWPLAELHARWRATRRVAAHVVAGVGIAFTMLWIGLHPSPQAQAAAGCFAGGRLRCAPSHWHETTEAIDAIARLTPAGARILSSTQSLAAKIRYGAYRPVVHSRWDVRIMLNATPEGLPDWLAHQKRVDELGALRSRPLRFSGWLALGRELGADYLLLDVTNVPGPPDADGRLEGHEVVWSNERFALIGASLGSS